MIALAVIGSAFGSRTLSSDRTLSRYRLSPYGSSLRISVFGLSCVYGPASGLYFGYGLVRPGAVSYGPSCDARFPNGSAVLHSQPRESRGGAAGFSADFSARLGQPRKSRGNAAGFSARSPAGQSLEQARSTDPRTRCLFRFWRVPLDLHLHYRTLFMLITSI